MRVIFLRILREPLTHFALFGLVVFLLTPSQPPSESIIQLDESQIAVLEQRFALFEGHPPSSDERKQLIESHIDEEILVREAKRLGLDHDDTIMRRRLVQKMRRLMEYAYTETPSSDALLVFLDEHQDRYGTAERIDLEHIYFSTRRRKDQAPLDATKALEEIRNGNKPSGDAFLRGSRFLSRSRREIAAIFGDRFATTAFEMDIAMWKALPSPYGVHLVRVTTKSPFALPSLDSIRPRLTKDWQQQQTALNRKKAVDGLRKRYTVRWP